MRPIIIGITGEAGSDKSMLTHLFAERLKEEGHTVYSNIYINGCEPLYLDKFLNFEYQNCWCIIDEAPAWFDCRESMGKNKKEHIQLSKIIFQHRKKHVGIIWNAQLQKSVELRLDELSQIIWKCEAHYGSGESFYNDDWPVYCRFTCIKGPRHNPMVLRRDKAMQHKDHFDSYQVVLTMAEEKARIIEKTDGATQTVTVHDAPKKSVDPMVSQPKTYTYTRKAPDGQTADALGCIAQNQIYEELKKSYPDTINSFNRSTPDIIIPSQKVVVAVKTYTLTTPDSGYVVDGRTVRVSRRAEPEKMKVELEYALEHGFSLWLWVKVMQGASNLIGHQHVYRYGFSEVAHINETGVLVSWRDFV